MDRSETFSAGESTSAQPVSSPDPRLQPTPDYGTLGPGSDIGGDGVASKRAAQPKLSLRSAQLLAATIGMVVALLFGSAGSAHPAWSGFTNFLSARQTPLASGRDLGRIDRMKPQKQAETLLELAVGNSAGAVDQISSRVDRWQGKVRWNSQIASLTTAALNSSDMRVRESGIEVELAAYGLGKNAASLDYVLKSVESPDHPEKIWGLWALGLMGNQGVQTNRVVEVLEAHLKDPDPDSRHWAVEGLALVGSDQTIEPLLKTMHDDPSPLVRERAACSLAESGMFTPEQRMTAVPLLLSYTDDTSLDAQTHGWAFQALTDITHQRLPNDSAAWRGWYNSTTNE
jgi:HEAT repeats